MARLSQQKVRYALVGAGNIAQSAVLPAFKNAAENSELVAIVSGDPSKRAVLAERYDVEHTGSYDDLEHLLEAARADAVYIATPNTLHREHTERAARCGVHVLCEKPMAMSVADCEAMIGFAHQQGVKLMIAYRLHFEEGNLTAARIVQEGQLGKVKTFTSHFSHRVRPDDIRTKAALGGGAAFDLGVYPINAVRSLFREEPVEVVALMPPLSDPPSEEVDETVLGLLRFASGRTAHLTVSQGAAQVANYQVVGTEGDLKVEQAYGTSDICHFLTTDQKTQKTTFEPRDQFGAELSYFSRCILEDREPEPSGEEGLLDVRVVCALLESARSGRSVRLAPFARSERPDLSQSIRKPAVSSPPTVNAPAPTR